jgi:hypothetical protein
VLLKVGGGGEVDFKKKKKKGDVIFDRPAGVAPPFDFIAQVCICSLTSLSFSFYFLTHFHHSTATTWEEAIS